ncbi:MAG: glycosyltransferase [Gammaproteobacteria bacterium]|jgi:glycosyltransferase involved in cell wall biosynthesis|nr:glycosyltransferase [Gammaproteobacteria bacterium]
MKILMVTQEPPLRDSEIVSGNAIRCRQLEIALERANHQVVQVWLTGKNEGHHDRRELTFRNRNELQGILIKQQPDAVLVSYWELLGLLPLENSSPVILDYVAPRSLEELYESPQTVISSLRRLRFNLQRCDLVLVGNELQKHLLVNSMIEAGFDLRGPDPVRVVPLGAEIVGPPQSDPTRNGWLLVSGGVSWPWRNSGPYQARLESFLQQNQPGMQLIRFGGQYRWHEETGAAPDISSSANHQGVIHKQLEPYQQFSEFLTFSAHIGVELADRNIERVYSQSFRSLEFLRHGLPLLCNRYLPFSKQVEIFDAGWVVDEPASLETLLPEIISHPDEWQRKSANALRLVSDTLHPDLTVKPLLDWLDSPDAPARLAPVIRSREKPPVLGVPPLRKRLARQFGLARTVLLNRLFGQDSGAGVVIVTRGDLFPTDHGAAVRTVETARALARAGKKVGIVTEDRSRWYELNADGMKTRKFPAWIRLLSLPGPLLKLLHFSKDLPYSNSFLYLPLTDRSFFWRTLWAARAVHAGVLQAEFPAYALPCIKAREPLNCSVVLVEHNVEYERIRAQVDDLTEQQYENLKAIEIDLCNRSDAVVCVSDNDRQKLGEDGVDADILHIVPHGVDLAQFDSAPAVDARQKFDIPEDQLVVAFHGTFSYPPNREALQIFADTLLPELEKRGLVCHLLAVGRNPPPVSPHPRIHLVGSVEQVGPWLRSADLSIVPLVDGGGTRMKIIDCFAAGLPVISTSKGIEGIPVVAGKQALILDNWEAIITAVIDLWENRDKAESLAMEGRALAENLSWDTIAENYQSLYNALC